MAEYFRRKYAETSAAADRFGEGEGMSDEITQQGLLPGVKWVHGPNTRRVEYKLYKYTCMYTVTL